MFKMKTRWQLCAGLLCIVFVASACFQSVGDVPQGNAVSERITETWTPIPSETPEPTEEETEEAEAVDQPISDVDTDTPTPTETATPTESSTPQQVAQSGEGGTGDSQPDAFQLTATELIRTATEGVALQQTATALALGIGIATETPIETATLDPFFLSQTPLGLEQPTQPFISGGDCVHEVRGGETMYSYSRAYGLPVNNIAAANAIVNPNIISIGQRITIPGCGTTGFRPPATSTPIPTITPFQFGTGGPLLTPDPGTGGGFNNPGLNTGACGGQYIVQQYDSLFQISLTCGVPVQSIANVNGIIDINYIKMGDILTIPAQ